MYKKSQRDIEVQLYWCKNPTNPNESVVMTNFTDIFYTMLELWVWQTLRGITCTRHPSSKLIKTLVPNTLVYFPLPIYLTYFGQLLPFHNLYGGCMYLS